MDQGRDPLNRSSSGRHMCLVSMNAATCIFKNMERIVDRGKVCGRRRVLGFEMILIPVGRWFARARVHAFDWAPQYPGMLKSVAQSQILFRCDVVSAMNGARKEPE